MVLSEKKDSILYKILTIIAGAAVMGFCWRSRGETGWGGAWGVMFAGFVFTMFIILAAGERKRLNYGQLGLAACGFMLTVPSWGTLLYQITGVSYSLTVFTDKAEGNLVYIPVLSGIFYMLCLGFGIGAVWGIFMGKAFGEKQWKIKDYIIILGVFFAVDLIAKASFAHWIVEAVQPQAAERFVQSVSEQGITGSAYKVYMQHFSNLDWAGKISSGARDYFTQVDTVSAAASAVAVLLADRFIVKDKRSANIGAVVCGAFAFAITVSDILFYYAHGGYHMIHEPYLPWTFPTWILWEYLTGFIAGGIITAVILFLKPKEDIEETAFDFIPEKVRNIISFVICMGFVMGVNIIRPVARRLRKEESVFQIIGIALAAVITVAVCAFLIKKFGFGLKDLSITEYSKYAFPLMICLTLVYYMFVPDEHKQNYKDFENIVIWIMYASAAVLAAWYALCVPKTQFESSKKKNNKKILHKSR